MAGQVLERVPVLGEDQQLAPAITQLVQLGPGQAVAERGEFAFLAYGAPQDPCAPVRQPVPSDVQPAWPAMSGSPRGSKPGGVAAPSGQARWRCPGHPRSARGTD